MTHLDSTASTGKRTVNYRESNERSRFYLDQMKSGIGGDDLNSLVLRALLDPSLFTYAHLYQASLPVAKGSISADLLQLLQTFAYGTIGSALPSLANHANALELTRKLQLLTLLSVCNSATDYSFPYRQLIDALHVDDDVELEQLLIDATYADIAVCSLDQKLGIVTVHDWLGRDLLLTSSSVSASIDGKSNAVGNVVDNLKRWLSKMQTLKEQLQQSITFPTDSKVVAAGGDGEVQVLLRAISNVISAAAPVSAMDVDRE